MVLLLQMGEELLLIIFFMHNMHKPEVQDGEFNQFPDRHKTEAVTFEELGNVSPKKEGSVSSGKGENMSPTKEAPTPSRAHTQFVQMPTVDDIIDDIFKKNDKGELANVFKSCLKVFKNKQVHEIFSLMFKNKGDRSILEEIQKNPDLIKDYRKSCEKENQSESKAISRLKSTWERENAQVLSSIIRKIITSRDILLIEQIENHPDATSKSKLEIIKVILTDQTVVSHLAPEPVVDVLMHKLHIILTSMKRRIAEPIIEIFKNERNFEFLNNMENYHTMDEFSLSKSEKDLIKSLASALPEYEECTKCASEDLAVLKFSFLKSILTATTITHPFSQEAAEISFKYKLIRELLEKPEFNIYVYKDRISRDYLTKILRIVDQPLLKYAVRTNYIEPLESRKERDIDSMLTRISSKIESKKLTQLKKALMEDRYADFFKDQEIASFMVTLWNDYYSLKNCTEAFKKRNKDVAKIEQELKWKIKQIFILAEIAEKVQQELLADILRTGNLLSIEKSAHISEHTKAEILPQIHGLPTFKNFLQANFQSITLQQQVRYQLANTLINIPVGSGGKQSLHQPLTFKKITVIIDKLIETKRIQDIETSTFLTGNEKPVIVKQLKNLLSGKSDSVFKEWICWQGIDLNVSFKALAPNLYKIIRADQRIDCATYEDMYKTIKDTADLDFIENVKALTESQKATIKADLEKNDSFKKYRSELNKKSLCISSFKMSEDIENQFPEAFEKEDYSLFSYILTDFLEFREDLLAMNLEGSKSLKSHMESEKVVKALRTVMDGDNYKLYSENFPLNFDEKEKKLKSVLQKQIMEMLDNLNPGKEQKNSKIYKAIEKQGFDLNEIKKNEEIASKTVVAGLEKIQALIDYNTAQFVRVNRGDLLSFCSYKKYIKTVASNLIPISYRDEIVELLLRWDITSVIQHADLSDNQKRALLKQIAGSKEFYNCGNVIIKGIPTQIPKFTEGVMEIIYYCISNGIDIDEDLQKLAKNEYTIQIQENPSKTYPTKTTFKEFLELEKGLIPEGMLLKVGNTEVTQQNFGSLGMNNKVLKINLYKRIEFKHKNSSKFQDVCLGADLLDAVVQRYIHLRDVDFQLTNGTEVVKGAVNPTTNAVVIEEIGTFFVNEVPIKQRLSSTFGDLKQKAKAPELKGEKGEVLNFNDADTLENVVKKVPSKRFIYEKPAAAIDYLQVFKDWALKDDKDVWGTLKNEPQNFEYAFKTIFEEKDMVRFIEAEFNALKKVRRNKIRDYLQELPQYKDFADQNGIKLIEKK